MGDTIGAPDMGELRRALTNVRNVDDAEHMAAYMQHVAPFLGVRAPARRQAAGPTVAALKTATSDELIAFADACWAEPEREFQYVACDALIRWHRTLTIDDLADVRRLVVTKSWWDTVDALATNVVAEIVRHEPTGWAHVDSWIDGENLWLARCALLQQLKYGAHTRADVLFDRCRRRAEDPEFFIRKAIGWALREYAKTDPGAVRTFLERHAHELSNLSVREASKHL